MLYYAYNLLFTAYVQQTGRAGRTGASCLAVLYYNMEDINRSTVTGEMREFCLLSRRQFMAEHFGYPIEHPRRLLENLRMCQLNSVLIDAVDSVTRAYTGIGCGVTN
jgi:superfamily II DNA helicase RecQ